MAETLMKLDREICGRDVAFPRVRRSAMIRIGEPVDVRSYLAGYEERGA